MHGENIKLQRFMYGIILWKQCVYVVSRSAMNVIISRNKSHHDQLLLLSL